MMANRDGLESRIELALRAWDVHVARCRECLEYGEHLCPEGSYAAEDIEAAQGALLRLEAKAERHAARLAVRGSYARLPTGHAHPE